MGIPSLLSIYIQIHASVHAQSYMPICSHAYIFVCLFACMYVSMHACVGTLLRSFRTEAFAQFRLPSTRQCQMFSFAEVCSRRLRCLLRGLLLLGTSASRCFEHSIGLNFSNDVPESRDLRCMEFRVSDRHVAERMESEMFGLCNSGVALVSILPETTMFTRVVLGSRIGYQSSLRAEEAQTCEWLCFAANLSTHGAQERGP